MELIESRLVLVLLLLTLVFNQVSTYQNLQAICERCSGTCNSNFCSIDATCRPLNRTSKRITFDVNFHKGVILTAPLIVEVTAYKKFRTEYRPFMIKFESELCHAIAGRNHPIFKFFDVKSEDLGTLLDPCPLKGRRHVAPTATPTNMVILIPSGEWKVDAFLSKIINGTKTSIFSVTYFYTVKATTAEEF